MRLLYFTVAWLAGILLGNWLWQAGLIGCATPPWALAVAAGASLIPLLAWRKHTVARYGVLVWLALLGAWRYDSHPPTACAGPDHVSYYNGDERQAAWVTLEGTVAAYPDVRDRQAYYRLRVERLLIGGEPARAVSGDVLLAAPRWPAWHYGDRLRVSGNLETPPVLADFDYMAYLARQGIHSRLQARQVESLGPGRVSPFWRGLYDLRERGVAIFNRALPEPAAALADGMLLGVDGSIAADLYEAFKATGTAHVIAISGSNIALFSGYLLAGLARLLGRRRALLPALAAIAIYVALVGGDPSAVRAGLMAAIYIGASLAGRQGLPLTALCASAIVMTAADPLTLFDAGFQLSCAATLGLILFALPLRARFAAFCQRNLPASVAGGVARFVGEALLITLAAQALTLPLTSAYFGRLSPLSLFANFLILPVQPIILLSGMLTLLAGALWPPLAAAAGAVPWLFLTYTAEMVQLMAGLPLATVSTAGWGAAAALAYYIVLAGSFALRRLRRFVYIRPIWSQARVWALAAALPIMLATATLVSRPDGYLHVIFVPIAGGEAALLITPAGRSAVAWDGRGDGAQLAAALRTYQRPWGPGPDLVLGAEALKLWPAAQSVDSGGLTSGQAIRLDDGVTLTRLTAGDEPALLASYGDFRVLLPAALGQGNQAALALSGAAGRLTVLKAPGAATGAWPAAELVVATAPQMILWPGETTYPPQVSALLAAAGATQVEADAACEVISDGARAWLRQLAGGPLRR